MYWLEVLNSSHTQTYLECESLEVCHAVTSLLGMRLISSDEHVLALHNIEHLSNNLLM